MAGAVVQRGDLVQLRLQRRQAGGFDLGLVVAGLPDVTDLGFHRAGLGLAGGGLLHQRVLHFQRALAQDLEAAPGGLVARHRVGLQPLAVDEAIEVGTGRNGRIEVGAVERDQRRLDLRQVEGRLGVGTGRRRGFVLATGGQRGSDGDGQAQRDQVADVHEALLRVISQGSRGREVGDRPKVTERPSVESSHARLLSVPGSCFLRQRPKAAERGLGSTKRRAGLRRPSVSYFALPWLATASAALRAASGSPR